MICPQIILFAGIQLSVHGFRSFRAYLKLISEIWNEVQKPLARHHIQISVAHRLFCFGEFPALPLIPNRIADIVSVNGFLINVRKRMHRKIFRFAD